MLMKVPSQYGAEFVRPKKRSPESAALRTVVDVEIMEVDEAAAPVVHVLGEDPAPLHADGPSHEYVPFLKIDGEPVEVRMIDGSHYVRRMTVDAFASSLGSTDDSNPFNGFYKDETGHFTAGVKEGHDKLPWDRDGFEASHGEMRKWDDHRHRGVAAITRRAAQFAAVEGWIYEKISEPALTLVMWDGAVRLRITETVHDDWRFSKGRSNYTAGYCIRFGVDEFARAISEGERLAEAYGMRFENRSDVRSHSPWHVRFRGEPELIRSRGWDFMNAASAYVASFDHLFGMAWHDLATAVSEHDRANVPAIEAMRRLVAMKDRIGDMSLVRRSTGYYHSHSQMDVGGKDIDRAMRGMEDALHMWDTRDASGIVWTEDGLGSTATYDGLARAYEVTDLMEADRVAALLGQDIAHMVATAATGKGALVAVEDQGIVRTVCYVENDGAAPSVSEVVTGHGAEPSRRHLALAAAHVADALSKGTGIEADLEAFGI